MTRWPIWLVIGILTGCATDSPALPDWNIPEASAEVTAPLPLPALPELQLEGDRAYIDRQGVIELTQYREAAEANTTIAGENAAGLEAQAAAYNALIQAGKFQAEIAAIRQEMLDQERRQALIDRSVYRAIILVGLAAAL